MSLDNNWHLIDINETDKFFFLLVLFQFLQAETFFYGKKIILKNYTYVIHN